MNKYQCQVCGAVSYSAASKENLKDNSCLECDGRVEMVDGDKMNADEIVRIDEAVKALHRLSELLVTPDSRVCCEAADLIESLQAQHKQAALNYQQKCRDVVELEAQLAKYDAFAADYGIDGKTMLTLAKSQIKTAQDNIKLQEQLAASQRRAQDARNELCLKCGRYRESHNGACNGCRWKE